MLTHRNMVSAAASIISYLENTADDVILNVLPLSFGYGLYQVLMAAQFGGTVVLEPSFAYPHAVLARLIDERATGLPLVPTMVGDALADGPGASTTSRACATSPPPARPCRPNTPSGFAACCPA